jgi:hypothetical protein
MKTKRKAPFRNGYGAPPFPAGYRKAPFADGYGKPPFGKKS